MVLVVGWSGPALAREGETGAAVVVVYNRRTPESKAVADHYAARREVPTNQVIGFELPTTETMTRTEYRDQLQTPLLTALTDRRLFQFGAAAATPKSHHAKGAPSRLVAARIRYLVLCYGVPLVILNDPDWKEKGIDKLRPELRRNEAAVDSELALLPDSRQPYPLDGPVFNPLYGATNAAQLQPTHGVLIVARLDGPSAAIAQGLVDKAIQAETDGLWGRAYFDLRGLTNSSYLLGDQWIGGAAELARRFGFDTVVDKKPATFSAAFPMSQIALYAGWYDGNVSGPFALPTVEFMPGAIAYHLHSFSAQSIRTRTQFWVGPLLAKGVTATMGCVREPYLDGTPNVAIFFSRLFMGFTFGEAAYASQKALSWQTTVVGDPLYRPFGKSAKAQHQDLLRRHSKLIQWSYLRAVNRDLELGNPVSGAIDYLESLPAAAHSAVLQEKLGDLYCSLGKVLDAIPCYQKALTLDCTPQQRIRVTLRLAGFLELFDRNEEAFALYEKFLKRFPDYPDRLTVYRDLRSLASTLGKEADAQRYQQEIQRLSPPTNAPPPAADH